MDTVGDPYSSLSSRMDCEEGDQRAFIELSELDKLLRPPPPRFSLVTDIEPFVASDSADSNTFDPEVEFGVQRPLPQRLLMDLSDKRDESETEVSFSNNLSQVSVVKSELSIGSDGQLVETECNSYLTELVPVPPLSSTSQQDEMLYNGNSVAVVRTKPWNRSNKAGTLNQVVSKLLARSDVTEQCLTVSDSVCDRPMSPTPTTTTIGNILPSPVLNKLKKLGTSVEVETPVIAPPTLPAAPAPASNTDIAPGLRQIMESLDKAVGLTTDLTKKKKRRSPKKDSNNQVPSINLQLLAEIENSEHLTKFTFQVDTSQVLELPEGQKLYTCDICSGVYSRGFSLKRHYLKTHINYKHISKRDLHNCGILFDSSIEKGGARKKIVKDDSLQVVSNLRPPSDISDLYRCHTCGKCFMTISDLKTHLMEHPPVSVQNLNDNQYKNYTCPNCKARYQKKKLFLQHKEVCGIEIAPLPPTPEKSPKKDIEIKITKNVPESSERNLCSYCDKSFTTLNQRKFHNLQMHHPKKKLQQCYLCKTRMFKDRLALIKHLILHHPDEYIGCLSCRIRFGTREEFKKHNKENHKPLGTAKRLLLQQKITAKTSDEIEEIEQSTGSEDKNVVNNDPNLIFKCPECSKSFASHLNMTRHHRIAHRLAKKRKKYLKKKEIFTLTKPVENQNVLAPSSTVPQKVSVPQTPPPDPETLFYSTVALNIRENLTHHLDGKLDSQEVMEYDLNKADTEPKSNKVLNFSASFSSENVGPNQPEATSTPIQLKEPRSVPISPRGQWEKFNFPKNYDGRCGLTSYVKDMSHLDISTQLTMRRNLQRLNSTAGTESNKESPANIPAGLLLVEKPGPDCAETFGNPDDNKNSDGVGTAELSGEWVRPRNFLCAACGYKSANLWDVEDHKYAIHPNAWVPHLEIVGHQATTSWDWFYHRRLPPDTEVEMVGPTLPQSPPSCSKCGRTSNSYPDLHWHMLDCGGDTTWQAIMLGVTSPGARRRKWRPFGSRKRKQQGRRLLKRNIPNTPAKHVCGRIRTKPGDMDTIQKMIANLPAKRSTRRVLADELDGKHRNQPTIANTLISSLSNVPRANGLKKLKRGRPRLNGPKKWQDEETNQVAENTKKHKNEEVKHENVEEVKEELIEPMEPEIMTQHSDILTSLQMIPVVRKSTETVEETEAKTLDEPIETSKILAAMREAMQEVEDKMENKPCKVEKKRKAKRELKELTDEKPKKSELSVQVSNDKGNNKVICNGCGMQFETSSSCQRHKKKCVYWKEDKNSESKSNKCVHCGSVFPYLMALLKHSCSKVDTSEEPAMPELCPEGLVEQVHGNSVEDIPILSPAEVSREDDHMKKMNNVEATINKVRTESFDVSGYYFKFSISPGNTEKKPEGDIEADNTKDPFIDSDKEDLPLTALVSKKVSSPKRKISNSSVKSQLNNPVLKNKKVSEMFKEVKRRGRRKGQKLKTKTTASKLATRTKLRKGKMSRLTVNTKNRLGKKGRSSNFVMLMKELEILRNEGAVAEDGGRRRRVTSTPIEEPQHKRTLRRRSPSNRTLIFELDYLTSDSMSIAGSELEYNEPKRTRLRRSNLTNKESSENFYDINQISKLDDDEEIITVKETVEKVIVSKKDEDQVKDTGDKEKISSPTDKKNGVANKTKKRLGISRSKNIDCETDLRINETIDNVLKMVAKGEVSHIEGTKQNGYHNVQNKTKNQDQENKTMIEKSDTNKTISNDLISSGIDESIFNVSVGTANVFKDWNMETLYQNASTLSSDEIEEINLSDPLLPKKRGRPKGWKKYPVLTPKPSSTPKINFSNGGENLLSSLKSSFKTKNYETVKECDKIPKQSTPKSETEISQPESSSISNVKNPTSKNEAKLKQFNEEDEMSGKIKEIKTKQQLMDDYLIFKKYMEKKSLETANKDSELRTNQNTEISPSKVIDQELKINFKESSVDSIDKGDKKKVEEKKGSEPTAVEDRSLSPCSTSSKEDIALSVIKDKAIKKKKKKLKLKKLMKIKRLEVVDNRVCKLAKPKLLTKEKSLKTLNKKLKKKNVKVGVSRNNWEVSIVENKSQPLTVLCDDYSCRPKQPEMCPSPYAQKLQSYLYPHEEGKKAANEGEEESDPMKYCKSIGSIINDLEKRTLTVAKVMHQLKREESGGVEAAVAEVEKQTTEGSSSSSASVEPPLQPQPDWMPLSMWEPAQQTWEPDTFSPSCNSSIGSIMDTVNKLLSSEQETVCPSLGNYTWSDLQLAMGASDEEMAILEQLGEHTLQEEYVYDSSRPLETWPLSEENPTLTDLDHPESGSPLPPPSSTNTSPSTTTVQASSTLESSLPSTNDTEEIKCRGRVPRQLLADYDSKEMVCPTCNKHFLGLHALQTHVSWSHCTPAVSSTSKGSSGQKRRAAMLSQEDGDRRFVCFVCKEILPSASLLDSHIQAQHAKKTDNQETNVPSESAEKLRSKMSSALGGLVDRALNKLLGSKPPSEPSTSQPVHAEVNTKALQLLGKLCAAQKRIGSENMKSSRINSELVQLVRSAGGRRGHKDNVSVLASELRNALGRRPLPGSTAVSKEALTASVTQEMRPTNLLDQLTVKEIKPTNLLDHLAVCSSDTQQRPYACPICDLRFRIPSTRNRHIARAHGKYGHRYDKDMDDYHAQDFFDNDWKEQFEAGLDGNEEEGGELLPLCSDCGLSFKTIHEVRQHRIEDHPRRFSAEESHDSKSEINSVVESSCETENSSQCSAEDVKLLPLSDNAVDSTSSLKKKTGRLTKKKMGRPPKRKLSESDEQKMPPVNKRKIDKNESSVVLTEDVDSGKGKSVSSDSNLTASPKSVVVNSPETDKLSEKSEKTSNSTNSSEENLADLSKKLDRRKITRMGMGNIPEEAVRVKAEAALRELNLSRYSKSSPSPTKWGVHSMKFTKTSPTGISSSQVNGSPSKPRFASLGDKKWKTSPTTVELLTPKTELTEETSDIYDFRDEEVEVNNKQSKDSPLATHETSESNNQSQSVDCNSPSPNKTPKYKKSNTSNS